MSKETPPISRRDVLKATSASVATAGIAGLGSAKPEDEVEIIVGYDSPDGQVAAKRVATNVVRTFDFDAMTIRATKQKAGELKQRSDVRYVEPNGTMEALDTVPWGVDRTDSEVAHASGYTGSGADIAILDTGIDSNHPDLSGNLGAGVSYASSTWEDGNGHGTHCAGIAAAENGDGGVVGVAPDATLHAVKVLSDSGGGSYSDIAAGIEWTANRGYDVASMSLGGGKSYAVEDAVEYASSRGVFISAAAGNDGPCSNCVGYPAAEPEAVAVSSTDQYDGLSSFSSQGPQIELAAPGSSIYSTYYGGGYQTLSGTSMACPHVSGAAALLMSSGYSASQARSRLKNTAEYIGLGSNESGAGLLDTAAALGLNSSDN